MINSTKVFTFNGVASSSFTPSILNVTLNNDFYEFAPLGARTVREEKVSGRDIPYFYDVDNDTLSFSMTIAFEKFATQAQVNEVIKWLYLPKTPKLLEFTEYNLNYFGLFVGQPRFYYVGNNIGGYKFIGYIEVEFKTNAPYGWTGIIQNTINTGDMEILPSFTIANTSNLEHTVTITNTTNQTSFTYILGYNSVSDTRETLTFNGYTKILSSNIDPNPYASWGSNYLIFDPKSVTNPSGANNITITRCIGTNCSTSASSTVTYRYRAPKIL